tara:strand:- start:928 stop:2082 length:1155 start_codon:yes stop_codon:yes gene_type:complete
MSNQIDKAHTYLLSYPRSASHWFRYCFKNITGRDIYLGWRYPIGRVTDRDPESEKQRWMDTYPVEDLDQFMESEYTFRGFRLMTGEEGLVSQQFAGLSNSGHLPHNEFIKNVDACGWPDKYLILPASNVVIELDRSLIDKVSSGIFYNVKNYVPKYFSMNNIIATSDGTVWMTEHWHPEYGNSAKLPPLSNYHDPDLLLDYGQPTPRFKKTNRVPEHVDMSDVKLLCIVRNHKEAVLSQLKRMPATLSNIKVRIEVKKFMKVLDTYDKFPYEKKMIYYEDLMTDPHETLNENIINFSGEGLGFSKEAMIEKLKMFLETQTYSLHQQDSIRNYRAGASGTVALSGGKFNHHRSTASAEVLKAIDDCVDEKYEDLKEKYLQRYQGI